MADKKEYSAEEVKVLIDINTSLVNITNAMSSMKSTMDDIVEMEKKHGTDLQLFNERMKFLQGLYNTLSGVVDDIKDKVTTLTTQLDYKERKELQTAVFKQREKDKSKEKSNQEVKEKPVKNPSKFWSNVGNFFAKNFKWLVILVCAIVTLIVLFWGGSESLKSVTDFWTTMIGGGK